MVRKLRQGPAKNGLILANGGTVTYQHVVCLSKHTRRDRTDYPATNPLPDKITDVPVPKIVEVADGEAEIEVSSLTRYCLTTTKFLLDVHCRVQS